MGPYGKGFTLAFFLLLICHGGYADDLVGGAFPLIRRLDSRDEAFRQFIADVESNRRRVFNLNRNRSEDVQAVAGFLTVYQYVPREEDDLFSLAARCNIPYSTLVSLNRLSHPSMVVTGRPLLLPSVPGIFVAEKPQSDLEHLLALGHSSQSDSESVKLTIGGVFHFFPGRELGHTERAFFLNRGFVFPLRNYRLTSGFGMRRNPISGTMRFHEGLDLAAPLGSEVYAVRDGIVTEVGNDPVLGNYIVIKHSEGWASLYGHLQRAGVALQSSVKSGTLIGWVGSTGQSTGPHLHFELRQNGKARDPDKYLFLPGGR
ncbi:MAG: M23 family metallopeptidase [Treponema sp.]|nr:M23 family metallopeptidase [Treponema sp.]